MSDITVVRLDAGQLSKHLEALSDILVASVAEGAAISFMLPFEAADARRFWETAVFPDVRSGKRALFGAFDAGDLVGTVQLSIELPPNQPHRCEVAKMAVHPRSRRRGIARALMMALEDVARDAGKTLVTLDTKTGDAAERLYASLGFIEAGMIPDFARDPDGGALHATTYMYKAL